MRRILTTIVLSLLSGCAVNHVKSVQLISPTAYRAALLNKISPVGSIVVRMHALDAITVKNIFGPAFAANTVVWLVTIKNATNDPVTVSESAVINDPRVAGLDVLPYAIESLSLNESQKHSTLGKITTVTQDITQNSIVLLASKIISAPSGVLTGLALFNVISPLLIKDANGLVPQVLSNFAALGWSTPITLVPGGNTTTCMFSRNIAADVELEIPVTNLLSKSVQ